MNITYFNNEIEFESSTQYYSKGFESTLYRYQQNDHEVLIKRYHDLEQIDINKIQTVNMLKTEGLLKPNNFLKIGNDIQGFDMDFKRGFYPLSNQKNFLNDIQKYNLIMDLKQILLSLRKENCIYGDLNLGNIITDGEETYLCDSVNVKIGNYEFDEISSTMRKYIERTGTTEGIDFYMLNLLTIYLFNDMEYEDIINNIEVAVTNFFNKQPYKYIIGVTDSMEHLDMCCTAFLSDQVCDSLLIDDMVDSIGLSDIENIRMR